MADDLTERWFPERTKSAVEQITTSIHRTLSKDHSLANPPDMQSALFVGYSQDQIVNVFKQLGAEVQEGLGPACTVTINKDPASKTFEQVVWFDVNDPNIKPLQNYTNYGFNEHKLGYSIVAEEVSHFLYNDQYFQKYGEEPQVWMTEMIGALDKYNLFQRMSILRSSRPMNSNEEQEAKGIILTALHSPYAPPEHSEGHKQSEKVIGKLNRLANEGKQVEAQELFTKLYSADEDLMRETLKSI